MAELKNEEKIVTMRLGIPEVMCDEIIGIHYIELPFLQSEVSEIISSFDEIGGDLALLFAAIQCTEDDRDLDLMVNHEESMIRMEVAKRGREKDLIKLATDPDYGVRTVVAESGNEQALNILMNDERAGMRSYVTMYANLKQLEVLEHDPEIAVRYMARACKRKLQQS